ncbi:hypothetical protein C8R46DRAFT_1029026 [Mycena filopes]|nr:hypothetical protein C8R46DRAFT_1029026 [Mycena filopes]
MLEGKYCMVQLAWSQGDTNWSDVASIKHRSVESFDQGEKLLSTTGSLRAKAANARRREGCARRQHTLEGGRVAHEGSTRTKAEGLRTKAAHAQRRNDRVTLGGRFTLEGGRRRLSVASTLEENFYHKFQNYARESQTKRTSVSTFPDAVDQDSVDVDPNNLGMSHDNEASGESGGIVLRQKKELQASQVGGQAARVSIESLHSNIELKPNIPRREASGCQYRPEFDYRAEKSQLDDEPRSIRRSEQAVIK